MAKWALVALLCGLLGTVHCQSSSNRYTIIRNRYAFIADKGFIASFAHECIDNTNKYNTDVKQSPSIETLINLVERLEDVVANTSDLSAFTSPDKLARMILQRFHMDSVNFKTVEQEAYVGNVAQIDTQIVGIQTGLTSNDYNFPDYVYTNNELCTMLFMFSHIFLNNTYEASRVKRATYQFQKSDTQPVNSPYVDTLTPAYAIQEKGVVSLRQDKNEAIAPARVLMGIITGMTDSPVLSGVTIANQVGSSGMKDDNNLKDAVLAVTLGSLMGTASFFEKQDPNLDQSLIFGVKGTWINETCCTYYETQKVSSGKALRLSNRGSLAQIRGALDGYILGNNLKTIQDAKQLRLSQILKSYYSFPHVTTTGNKLGLSYCDRRDNKPNSATLNEVSQSYNRIYNYIFSRENTVYRGDLLSTALDQAAAVQDFCTTKRPSGNLDNNSPSETPSDIIFVVDPKTDQEEQLVSSLISKISKIDRYGGAVSVFLNSNQRTNVELPTGPGGWPLGALVFNSTNTGSVVCQITPQTTSTPITSLGKYLMGVNQTILDYKWWTPRRWFTGVPSKNVILIDSGTLVMPTSGPEKDDYYTYKEALKWRNRDVFYGVVSPNKDLFKEFVREEADILTIGSPVQSATTFANKISENPATLTYSDCYSTTSQNVTYEGFITPGYKQNWAMYPEYFKASSSIEFKIKAVEGSIRYCWDRTFPPARQEYCKELQENGEDSFKIWGPCSGQSVYTCSPVYVTVWGKDRSTMCKDIRCLSMDQAKFSIGHTGAFCNSALKVSSFFLLQVICFVLVWLHGSKSL